MPLESRRANVEACVLASAGQERVDGKVEHEVSQSGLVGAGEESALALGEVVFDLE